MLKKHFACNYGWRVDEKFLMEEEREKIRKIIFKYSWSKFSMFSLMIEAKGWDIYQFIHFILIIL